MTQFVLSDLKIEKRNYDALYCLLIKHKLVLKNVPNRNTEPVFAFY